MGVVSLQWDDALLLPRLLGLAESNMGLYDCLHFWTLTLRKLTFPFLFLSFLFLLGAGIILCVFFGILDIFYPFSNVPFHSMWLFVCNVNDLHVYVIRSVGDREKSPPRLLAEGRTDRTSAVKSRMSLEPSWSPSVTKSRQSKHL